jgi:hypothetical protein
MYSIEGSRLKSNGDNIVYKDRSGDYEHYSNLERGEGMTLIPILVQVS